MTKLAPLEGSRYLGDSVYIRCDAGRLHLFVPERRSLGNSIYLGEQTLQNLLNYVAGLAFENAARDKGGKS